MIYTIKGDILIELSQVEDEFLKRNRVVFHPEDMLKSAVDERKKSIEPTELDRFNDLNCNQQASLQELARQMGGSVGGISFDKDKCITLGNFYKVGANTSSSTISVQASHEYCLLSKKVNEYYMASHKTGAIYKAYSRELTCMLNRVGIRHIVSKELKLALRHGDYDLDDAFIYATENIYTPMKLIMSELWLNSKYLNNLKRKTKTKDVNQEIQDHLFEINFLDERHRTLVEEMEEMKDMFFLKLRDYCAEKLVESKVMTSLKSYNWNMDATFEHIITHLEDFVV